MKAKTALGFDVKPALFAIALYFPIGMARATIPEYGHIVVCTSAGYQYDLWFDATGGHMRCKPGQPTNEFLYNVMGGTLGLIAAAGVTLPYLFKRHYLTKALVIVGLSFVVLQIENSILETFYTIPYEHHVFDVDVTAIHSFALMMCFIILNLRVEGASL